MQVDWVEFRRRKGANLFAFVATLGYSRATYVEFVSDMRLDTLLRCHVNCFNWFGGVPRRALLDFVAGNKIGLLCPLALCGPFFWK